MIPFTGEVMTCVICKCQQRSDPNVESQWRCIELDGVRFYACPKEFPPDGASAAAFERAYGKVLVNAVKMFRDRRRK